MRKHTPKHRLSVIGKMNTHDSGTVGKLLAIGATLFATCCGLAILIHALRWW